MKQIVINLALFLSIATVYYKSPVHYAEDSAYSLLMDEAILHQGSPNLIAYQLPRGTGAGFSHGYSWNIALIKGRLIYAFPWGLPLLSLPGMALADAFGYSIAPNHVYNGEDEIRVQAVFTAVLSAVTICLVYETAASLLPLSWALIIALSVAFGTQMWSSVSRSLWAQTWYLLLIAAVILFLARGWRRPVLMATLLAWSGFVRPMAAPTLVILGFYILLELASNRARITFIATGILWAAGLSAVMVFFVGHLLAPVYNPQLMAITGFDERLMGILFSPGRGLLIYVPIVLVPLYLTARYWRDLPRRGLAVLALAGVASTTITLACCQIWWGGWSYGPRDLVETLPWLTLLTILGVRAFLDDVQLGTKGRAVLIGAAIMLLTISVAMNAPGALSPAADAWNARPNIDTHPQRLWDWRHPQFLAWYQRVN